MQEYPHTEEEKTKINRNVFLQKIPENYFNVNNEKVLVEMIRKGTLTHKIRNRQLEFIAQLMRKDGLENYLSRSLKHRREIGESTRPPKWQTCSLVGGKDARSEYTRSRNKN